MHVYRLNIHFKIKTKQNKNLSASLYRLPAGGPGGDHYLEGYCPAGSPGLCSDEALLWFTVCRTGRRPSQ